MSIHNITKKTYTQEILNQDGLVLVDYWAPWCGPCKMLSPILEQVAKEVEGVKICKINVDEEPELAAEQMVRSIPMLTLVNRGKIVNKSVGLRNKNEILAMISKEKKSMSTGQLKTAEIGE